MPSNALPQALREEVQRLGSADIMGVAERASKAGKPCICFGGGATPQGIAALAALGAIVVPVIEQPSTVEEAMAAGSAPLTRAAERAARLVSLGATA